MCLSMSMTWFQGRFNFIRRKKETESRIGEEGVAKVKEERRE